jgi:hypothetical protein
MKDLKTWVGWTAMSVMGILALGVCVKGHNLWVTAEGTTVQIVFEHSPEPGEGTYNTKILNNGQTWVRSVDHGDAARIALIERGQPGALFLNGKTQVTAPRVVEHSFAFGIYGGRLDYFYGKFIEPGDIGQLPLLGRAPKLTLDIVPRLKDAHLELTVLWQGELLRSYRFGVITPNGKEISLQANNEGVVIFKPSESGIYGFWAIRLDDEVSGVHEGEQYFGTMHGTTLSLRWPLGHLTP